MHYLKSPNGIRKATRCNPISYSRCVKMESWDWPTIAILAAMIVLGTPQEMSLFQSLPAGPDHASIAKIEARLYQKVFLRSITVKPTFKHWKACLIIRKWHGWGGDFDRPGSRSSTTSFCGPLTSSYACTLGRISLAHIEIHNYNKNVCLKHLRCNIP